jgi:cellulose synthase/poly-beta-1,6-N-acetylglucosamine synthase-like glycosyltransferase
MPLAIMLISLHTHELGIGLLVFGSSALFYIFLLYPAGLWLVSSLRRPRTVRPCTRSGVTLIISAQNEGACIRKKLEDTLGLNYPREKLQILVVSDGSTDSTDAIVSEFSTRGVELLRISQRGGKTQAQNIAVTSARHEILVFSDATTLFHPMALQYLVGAYNDLRVGAVSGRYQYFDPTHISPTAAGTIAFWNFENRIKQMQSTIFSITGCCGCIYSVRRSLYTKLPANIISDLVQPLHVLLQGFTVHFEARALAWEETTASAHEEFAMRVRVITRGMRGLLSIPRLLVPWRNPWIALQLWSHKVLRWMAPVFFLCVLAGNMLLFAHPVFRYLLLLQGMFYLAAVVAAAFPAERRPRLLSLPLYLCTMNAASLISFCQLLQGKSFATWQPVRR